MEHYFGKKEYLHIEVSVGGCKRFKNKPCDTSKLAAREKETILNDLP